MRPVVESLEESRIREVANAGMGLDGVLKFWFGESDEVTPDFIREGIRRLSTVINGELELLSTFSQTAPLPVVRPEPTMINPPANLG